MDRTPVSSSIIASAGYDTRTGTLEVEFHNGMIYLYFDVPEGVYEELIDAPSAGAFFNSNIKGVFRYARA
jgi:hypothetical protein